MKLDRAERAMTQRCEDVCLEAVVRGKAGAYSKTKTHTQAQPDRKHKLVRVTFLSITHNLTYEGKW